MFTVRIDHDGLERSVYQCARYEVARNGGAGVRLTMFGVPGVDAAGREVLIDGSAVAFVMNELGNSVDCVRPARKVASA